LNEVFYNFDFYSNFKNNFVGLQKISLRQEEQLTEEEVVQLNKLLLVSPSISTLEEPTSFTQSILKEVSQIRKKKYMDVDFIPVGSVIVESLFSSVAYMFDEKRLSSTPVHVEEQVFLRNNKHLWNLHSFVNNIEISELDEGQ
jgi:hypothetical protein